MAIFPRRTRSGVLQRPVESRKRKARAVPAIPAPNIPRRTARGTVDPLRHVSRAKNRSAMSTVPLAVLLGMFGLGIAGTALALRFRDSSGR